MASPRIVETITVGPYSSVGAHTQAEAALRDAFAVRFNSETYRLEVELSDRTDGTLGVGKVYRKSTRYGAEAGDEELEAPETGPRIAEPGSPGEVA